jgi:hypothetical protein
MRTEYVLVYCSPIFQRGQHPFRLAFCCRHQLLKLGRNTPYCQGARSSIGSRTTAEYRGACNNSQLTNNFEANFRQGAGKFWLPRDLPQQHRGREPRRGPPRLAVRDNALVPSRPDTLIFKFIVKIARLNLTPSQSAEIYRGIYASELKS